MTAHRCSCQRRASNSGAQRVQPSASSTRRAGRNLKPTLARLRKDCPAKWSCCRASGAPSAVGRRPSSASSTRRFSPNSCQVTSGRIFLFRLYVSGRSSRARRDRSVHSRRPEMVGLGDNPLTRRRHCAQMFGGSGHSGGRLANEVSQSLARTAAAHLRIFSRPSSRASVAASPLRQSALICLSDFGSRYPGASCALFAPYRARGSRNHSAYSNPRRLWSGEQSMVERRSM